MVTKNVPPVVELKVHEALVVVFAVTVVAVAGQIAVSPAVGLVTALRLTLPAKFRVLVRLTDIVAPEDPLLKLTGVPTLMLKSPT